jgi:hypothetical protein
MKMCEFIKSMTNEQGITYCLFQVGNYQYEIDTRTGDSFRAVATVDGSCEDAINVMESLAVL